MKFLVKESIKKHSEATGKTVVSIKKDLSELLYPGSTPESREVLMSLLWNGKVKKFPLYFIPLICEKLGTTPNQLFGYE
jgi:hypothetical protein